MEPKPVKSAILNAKPAWEALQIANLVIVPDKELDLPVLVKPDISNKTILPVNVQFYFKIFSIFPFLYQKACDYKCGSCITAGSNC